MADEQRDGGALPNQAQAIGGKGADGLFHILLVGNDGSLAIVPASSTRVDSGGVLKASQVIFAGAKILISLTVSNTKSAAQFVQIFDSATVPADTTVPLASYKVPAADGRSFDIPITGMAFSAGISVCNSSTQATKTIGSADCLFLAVVR